MNTNEFNKIVDDTLDKIRSILVKKAAEYATDDRLHNFKVAAELQKTTSREALAGMMAKHTVSVYDLCRAEELASPEMWDEKIVDHLNYLVLLRAVVAEERSEEEFVDNAVAFPTVEEMRARSLSNQLLETGLGELTVINDGLTLSYKLLWKLDWRERTFETLDAVEAWIEPHRRSAKKFLDLIKELEWIYALTPDGQIVLQKGSQQGVHPNLESALAFLQELQKLTNPQTLTEFMSPGASTLNESTVKEYLETYQLGRLTREPDPTHGIVSWKLYWNEDESNTYYLHLKTLARDLDLFVLAKRD